MDLMLSKASKEQSLKTQNCFQGVWMLVRKTGNKEKIIKNKVIS